MSSREPREPKPRSGRAGVRQPRARQVRARRDRTATESLLSIVLLLEAILVFFVTLVAYGLKVVPIGVAFGGGAALFLILLLVGRVVRYPWGEWSGWVLQAVLILLGLLIPLMWFIGVVFAGIWTYCFITGHRLERQKAEYFASNPPAGTPPAETKE